MILRKEEITEETALKYFPQLKALQDRGVPHYIVEVCALPVQFGKKTVLGLIISADKEIHDNDMVMRMLYNGVPVVREKLDKPMRPAQRETIYAQAVTKLSDACARGGLSEDHPYRVLLNKM